MGQTVWKKGIIDDFILFTGKGKYSVENNPDFTITRKTTNSAIYEYKIKETGKVVTVCSTDNSGFVCMIDQDNKNYCLMSNEPYIVDGVTYKGQEQYITTLENEPSITFNLYKDMPNNGFALAMFYDPEFRYTVEVDAEIKNLVRWAQSEYMKE